MVNIIQIDYILLQDGEALYNQLKQDKELNVAQIMTPYSKIQT